MLPTSDIFVSSIAGQLTSATRRGLGRIAPLGHSLGSRGCPYPRWLAANGSRDSLARPRGGSVGLNHTRIDPRLTVVGCDRGVVMLK